MCRNNAKDVYLFLISLKISFLKNSELYFCLNEDLKSLIFFFSKPKNGLIKQIFSHMEFAGMYTANMETV